MGGDEVPVAVEGVEATVEQVLTEIEREMYDKALTVRTDHTLRCGDYAEFSTLLESQGGWYLVPWCDDSEQEDIIKAETRATIRCYPLEGQDEILHLRYTSAPIKASLPAGDKLVLFVGSNYYPVMTRNRNNAAGSGYWESFSEANLELLHSETYPSSVTFHVETSE